MKKFIKTLIAIRPNMMACENEAELSSLPPGYYIVSYRNGNEILSTTKYVKK